MESQSGLGTEAPDDVARGPGPRGDAAMRNRPGLLPFVAPILASPPLIAAAGAGPGRDLAGVELPVAAGLGSAAWWRRDRRSPCRHVPQQGKRI